MHHTNGSCIQGWETVTLRGGPHDGQAMLLHESQASITLYDGLTANTYHRISGKPELYAEDRVARLLGCGNGGGQ